MASGLIALLDDIAGIAKLAAASLDDVGAAAGRASVKAAGVVVDDTAVTPRYVMGLSPQRELPIIAKIALGSLRNKLLIILPAALLLSAFAPWAITPILMLGGLYLCFEGAEKVLHAFNGHGAHADEATEMSDPAALEAAKVSGAIRTDLILSAEIMAIALADVAQSPILTQALVLAVVGLLMTVGVYGVVALIVKIDDIGLHLVERGPDGLRRLGRALVNGMPKVMQVLSVVGTAAMLWVGGGILLHGLGSLGWHGPTDLAEHAAEAAGHLLPFASAAIAWAVFAIISGVIGLVLGGVIVAAKEKVAG
ncbi:ABC transporter [Aureimonas endophytica]|uniref:ABC transporter n=1 Tax=Aureimonas endophytica TaxID=2027858 RepID=A0A916ZDF8_9HYPH|nr:DUF808 domain-containing protein [Aureimonas endophytica]GGD88993.1 ABC transporter [Aureimonas endophytica]